MKKAEVLKNNRGITLIALVITIIVLLILAGVTINMVLGDDGIIQNAQKAKERYEEEAEKEQDALAVAAGNLDLHTKGTVANTVKVGDYVEYTYDAPTKGYTTPEKGTGLEVNDETEYFNSATGGNAEVTAWRVLSKKDGIVKLVAETPISTELTLYGANGWVNGPTVLDEMCKTLYSSDIGTGRSINVEDVNEITKYDGTKYYWNYDDKEEFPAGETRTIAEAAKTAGENGAEYDMDNFASEVPEEGKNIGDYEITYYYYDVDDKDSYTNQWLTAGDKEYQLLFGEDDMYYWLASSCVRADFRDGCASFYVRYVGDGSVSTNYVFDSFGGTFNPAYAVRPVVTLKSGLKIAGGNGESADTAWTIKVAD